MPTLLKWNGFRFYFFSNEGFEPPHIHVDKDGCSVKIWLTPVTIAHNYGFKDKELNAIVLKVNEKKSDFVEAWHEYFKQ